MFNPEVRLDMAVVSGARQHHAGSMRSKEPARKSWLLVAVRKPGPWTQPLPPLSTLRNSIHQGNPSRGVANSRVLGKKRQSVFSVTGHTPQR